jgi:hypothetical protein
MKLHQNKKGELVYLLPNYFNVTPRDLITIDEVLIMQD